MYKPFAPSGRLAFSSARALTLLSIRISEYLAPTLAPRPLLFAPPPSMSPAATHGERVLDDVCAKKNDTCAVLKQILCGWLCFCSPLHLRRRLRSIQDSPATPSTLRPRCFGTSLSPFQIMSVGSYCYLHGARHKSLDSLLSHHLVCSTIT